LLESDKALIDLLFSEENKAAQMDVGFKGNPNIGSVVLNQFTESPEFGQFVNSFTQGDSIFIVSSIFGGTGAAGFPLLVKNLRELDTTHGNTGLIKESNIGAISFLPYFQLDDGKKNKSKIESSTFIQKTVTALRYYNENLTGNNSIDYMYYLGDISDNFYENFDGSKNQKNKAHFLELVGAIAIFDYCKNLAESQKVNDRRTVFKEFGIEKDDPEIDFKSLGPKTSSDIFLHLSKFKLISDFVRNGLKRSITATPPWIQFGPTKTFFAENDFETYIKGFLNQFDEWLNEMEKNVRPFKPFKKQVGYSNGLDFIRGSNVRKSGFFPPKLSLKYVDSEANKLYSKNKYNWKGERTASFIELINESAYNTINKNFVM
jgi:hypothetical protein